MAIVYVDISSVIQKYIMHVTMLSAVAVKDPVGLVKRFDRKEKIISKSSAPLLYKGITVLWIASVKDTKNPR